MLPTNSLLPLHGFTVTLRFIEKTQIGFFHQLSLTPFIRFLLNSPTDFDTLIRIDTPESGRLNYKLGDCYRFTVYGLKGSESLLQQLIEQLQKLPDSALKNDKKLSFRRNCQLISLHDAFCEQAITDFNQLSGYCVEDLQEEIQRWQSQSQFSLNFLSPIRLLKDKPQREGLKGEERYCRQLTDLDACLINSRLHDNFADLLRRRGINDLPPRIETKGLMLTNNTHLFWLDAQYSDEKNKAHVIGGMTGEICLSVEDSKSINWGLWVLGQYTGFGQRTAFGWGRYQLQTADKTISCKRASPAQSLLTQIADIDNLIAAFKHIEANVNKEVISEDYETDAILLNLEKDIEALISGEFKAPNLHGVVKKQKNKSPSIIANPPFKDKILQQAVVQMLKPSLAAIAYPCYATLDFDAVDWNQLTIRLQALWGNDLLIVAIMNWMQVAVQFNGQLIQRQQGLPQGSPLSLLMHEVMSLGVQIDNRQFFSAENVKQNEVIIESGERDERGLLLCITGQSCILSTCEGRLNVDRSETEIYSSPWRHLQAVLLFGLHHITTPALKSAMEFNVPVHFCSATGVYDGVVWNGQTAYEGCDLWLKQQQCFENPSLALHAAKQVVLARLHHIKETLRLRAKKREVESINEIIAKVPAAESLTTLNGLEGSGARLYFSALKDIVPSEFKFSGRNRQPPQDPYNSLLSLGFTLLYSCVESLLRVDGLLPWCGFYHQPHGKHATLASDLMEPFRHVVERLALALLKRGELKVNDFYITQQGACYLNREARNLYLSKLIEKFDTPIKAKDEIEAKTLFEHLHQQNLSLIGWIENKGEFKVWRIK